MKQRDYLEGNGRKFEGGYFSGMGKGIFHRLLKATEQDELTDDLKGFNETVAVICASSRSHTHSTSVNSSRTSATSLRYSERSSSTRGG